MKRKVGTSETDAPSKKLKEAGTDVEAEAIKELEPIQAKLLDLDDECVKEQLKVQRKFADQMRPLFLERQKAFQKIPNFWGRVVSNLPLGDLTFCDEDADILEHLEVVDLEDNLDEKGSYKLTFKFGPGVSEFFEPAVLEKTVLFDEKGLEATSTTTPIQWKPGKNIVEIIQERRKNKAAESTEDDDDDEDECSVFEWFSDTPSAESIPLGDIFRRDVWQNPLVHLYSDMSFDDADDLEDEDEDNESQD